MRKKTTLNIFLLLFLLVDGKSQEIVTGLQSDRRLMKGNLEFDKTKGSSSDTLDLPFFDDFSGRGMFPDSKMWSDNDVLVNNSYTDRQITAGVATFDALDNTGMLYETAASRGFEADHLTSQPLNLNFPASDSIYLSFLFQPGGLADMPESNDSLTLQFFAPSENKWFSVWYSPGNNYPGFKTVVIRIDQSKYLKKGFRFRFTNYASLSPNLIEPSILSNCDQWNIDYILLDKSRSASDTIFRDVAFTLPLRSILKTFEAMPWKQFKQAHLQEMGSFIPVHYRNNDTIVRNITRNFEIRDIYKNTITKSFSAGATDLEPLNSFDYNTNLIYTFTTDNNDSAIFSITARLVTDVFDPKENDTMIYNQVFSNYFAYDDGTAEGGYGINGLGSRNAMVALRFKSFILDTLRAISICFNDSYMNANKRAFDLMIWDDDDGKPGNVIYSREEVMVEQGEEINGFYTYFLPVPVPVNNIFYVGWKQRTETFLNAGFDINTPHKGKQFYWINGSWNLSQANGILMLRPVLGAPVTTSVNDIIYRYKPYLHFWPNPACEFITIDPESIPVSGITCVSIFDLRGRELLKVPVSDKIDISSLREGFYIIVATCNGKQTGYGRLIKTK